MHGRKHGKPITVYTITALKTPHTYQGCNCLEEPCVNSTESDVDTEELSPSCTNGDSQPRDFEAAEQTIAHIVVECPKRRFSGTWKDIFTTSPIALEWIDSHQMRLQHLEIPCIFCVNIAVNMYTIRNNNKNFYIC